MLLVLLLHVAGCASSAKHSTSAGFPTRVDATEEQFLALLDEVGWEVTEEEEDFHVDPRGAVGKRYELERADGKGFASVFIFDFEEGNGSLLMEVSEQIEGGSMLELIEGLRQIFDAAPTWRDRGVLIVGDAIIGNPPGQCGLLPERVMDDPARLRTSVRAFLGLDFDTLLVGDGEAILRDAKARVKELVETFAD